MQEIEKVFITKGKYDLKKFREVGYDVSDNLYLLTDFLDRQTTLYWDTENSSLDPFRAIPLLESIGTLEKCFVIDKTTILDPYLKSYLDRYYIGHNIQYDYVIAKQTQGIELRNVGDTMITERVIGRGYGRSNSLENIHLLRLGYEMKEDKATRDGFVGATRHIKFVPTQVSYSGYDVECLPLIVKAQEPIIKKAGLEKRIYDIAFGVIPILGDMYLEGININEKAWLQRLQEDKRVKLEIEKKLDSIIEKLSTTYPEIRGGKYTRNRQKQELVVKDIWGNITDSISNQNTGNINYNSSPQVLDIFRKTNEPLPTTIDLKTYETKISVGKPALEDYIIDNPTTKLKDFCRLLIEHGETNKAINSFGYQFLQERYRPETDKKKIKRGYFKNVTGKVHTRYKQETTANGRLASGDDIKEDRKVGVFNSQNVPKEKRYRVCFTLSEEEIAEGWWITTMDYSSAELIILGALSGDKKLLEIQKDDIHSYLATASFNKIIKHILDNTKGNRREQELYDLLRVNKVYNSKYYSKGKEGMASFTHSLVGHPYTPEDIDRLTRYRVQSVLKHGKIRVSKNHFADIRAPFKNVVYGLSYGAQAKKIASSLRVAKYYGEIVKDAMYEELPIALGYLDRMSRKGVKNGYIKFNNRTNSRHLFREALDTRKYGDELPYKVKGKIERQCKNLPISGTQADMILESMVEIDKYGRDSNHEFKFLLQVHDELAIKHRGKGLGAEYADIMSQVANKYLNGITEMEVEFQTLHTWTK